MKLNTIISMSVAGALVTIGCAQAVILEVPDQYPTISEACQAAMAGDTVGVYPGVYEERYAPVRAGVTVLGMAVDSTHVCVRPLEPSYAPFRSLSGDLPVVIENMQIRAGGLDGAIANASEQLEVRRCYLISSEEPLDFETLVLSWEGNVTIRKCHVELGDLGAPSQHVFIPFLAGHFVLEDCIVEVNEWIWMVLYYTDTPAGTVYQYKNNTILGHVGAQGLSDRQFSVYVVNNILWDYNCAYHPLGRPEIFEFRYNCFMYSCLPPDCGYQIGNFVADPLFCEPAAGDYRLQPQSPCIGAGEHGENVGARLGVCWPTDVVKSPKSVAGGLLWRLSPNPTTGGVAINLDGARWTSDPCPIEIFDVTGKLARLLGPPDWESNVRAHWDGRLADGRDAPAGVYHVRVGHAKEEQATRRVIMLR